MSITVSRLSVRFTLVLVLLAACSGLPGGTGPVAPAATSTSEPQAAPTGTSGPILEDILVESVEIRILESFPVQVEVVARGQLPDACSFVEDVIQERQGGTFLVTLTLARQPNMRCAPQPTPFEQVISLDVLGLEAGEYSVDVNGASETFELAVDNILENE